jgi:hypothetical protein
VGSALRPREVVGHLKVDAQLLGEDPEASLITRLRSLKNRPRSRTGEMIRLKYNLKTAMPPEPRTWLREV